MVITVLSIPAAISGGFYALRHTNIGGKLLLKAPSFEEVSGQGTKPGLEELLGQIGQCTTPLCPGGTVEIGLKQIDAVSQGEYIASGSKVKVCLIEGNRVVVAAYSEPETTNQRKEED